ncbi:hypothetical protein [Acuticoccus sp. I52.16.1]|uniref:hypothetical protein n=1 Tax=Acuticoccus sp. I52.16.1 TaxID=2928472 RepID=UPI001FD39535|nr:hypothetical protein [Acuticoccus sp. I52.16.1]UOM35050.1 hypothetical protein MRB58_02225 [Acuticoccus sp. I52.16.1]
MRWDLIGKLLGMSLVGGAVLVGGALLAFIGMFAVTSALSVDAIEWVIRFASG